MLSHGRIKVQLSAVFEYSQTDAINNDADS
jgi:hypothetical protein